MKRKTTFIPSLLLSLAFLVTVAQAAMQSESYRIDTSVISGGGVKGGSETYQTSGTLGQSTPGIDQGRPSSPSYQVDPGFWNAASSGDIEYSISGTVTGDIQAGVTITLSGAASKTTTTDNGGDYSFSGLLNGLYTVTPSLSGYTFTPVSRQVEISGADVTGVDFVAAQVSPVSVKLVPDATTIPRGGTLGLKVYVRNNTTSSQTFKFWTYLKLPSGQRYPVGKELFGPVTVTLSAVQTKSAHLTQKIPTTAPLGTYTYYGNVGPYPTVWDTDSFQFTVTATGGPEIETQNEWETFIEWTE